MLYFSSEWLLEAVVLDTMEANIKIISSPQSLLSLCRYYFLNSLFLLFVLSLAYILEIALWCFPVSFYSSFFKDCFVSY